MRRKRFFILSAAVISAVCCAVCSAAASVKDAPADAKYGTSGAADKYTLTEYGGSICVFRNGGLILDSDIDADGLRKSDRQMLEDGIHADSYSDILRMLEDFGS